MNRLLFAVKHEYESRYVSFEKIPAYILFFVYTYTYEDYPFSLPMLVVNSLTHQHVPSLRSNSSPIGTTPIQAQSSRRRLLDSHINQSKVQHLMQHPPEHTAQSIHQSSFKLVCSKPPQATNAPKSPPLHAGALTCLVPSLRLAKTTTCSYLASAGRKLVLIAPVRISH
jgi:hypothetical protein